MFVHNIKLFVHDVMNKNVHRVKTKAYYIMMFKNTYVKTESHHRIEKKQCHSDECTCHNDNITSHNAKLNVHATIMNAHHVLVKAHHVIEGFHHI